MGKKVPEYRYPGETEAREVSRKSWLNKIGRAKRREDVTEYLSPVKGPILTVAPEDEVHLPVDHGGTKLEEPLPPSPSPFRFNLRSDFGAVGDGVNTDGEAFRRFRQRAREIQAQHSGAHFILRLPAPGDYTYTYIPVVGDENEFGRPFSDIRSLEVVCDEGATVNRLVGTGVIQQPIDHHQSFIETIAAGATSCTLITPSQIDRYNVNDWVMLGGVDLQGGGFPNNLYYHEYLQVGRIDGATIHFRSPTRYAYKSHWPLNFIEFGGPAAIYRIDEDWTSYTTMRNVTYRVDEQMAQHGLEYNMIDCEWNADIGPVPTQSRRFNMIGGSAPISFMEVDKLIEELYIENYTTGTIQVQSVCVELFTLKDSTLTEVLSGAPKRWIIDNVTVPSMAMGASLGQNLTTVISDSTIGAFSPHAGASNAAGQPWTTEYTYVGNGLFERIGLSEATAWLHPEAKLLFKTPVNGWTYYPFTVTDVSQIGDTNYFQTDFTGALPVTSEGSPTHVYILCSPSISVTNSSGCAEIEELSFLNGEAVAFGEFSRRTYTASGNGPTMKQLGEIVEIRVNVTVAGTGFCHPFGLAGTGVFSEDWVLSSWNPKIDLSFTGERVITQAGGTGLQGLDDIGTVPFWVSGFSNNHLTGNATVTVQMRTSIGW